MKNSISQLIAHAVWATLLCASCAVPRLPMDVRPQSLPGSFAGQSDPINSGTGNWRLFFADSILVALVDTALKNNPDVQMALQTIERAGAEVLFSRGAMLPTVQGGTSAALRRFGLYTMDGAGNASTDILPGRVVPAHLPDFFVGLQTTWEADIWGKLRNRKKAAQARFLVSQEGKHLVMTNLIAEVAVSYYQLLALDIELDIIGQNIAVQENALVIVQVQKEAAVANALAVQQFEAQLLNTRTLQRGILQQIIEAENRLNFLLGRFPQPLRRNKSAFLRGSQVGAQIGSPIELLQNRPDIRQAEFNLVATKADLRAVRTAFYPSLAVLGSAGFQAFSPGLLLNTPQSVAYSLLGSLAGPLVNRSALKAHFRVARANQAEASYQYQKVVLNAFTEVCNQVTYLNNLALMRNFKGQEVSILTEGIGTAIELFKTGRATYLEVLLAQQNLLKSSLDLVIIQHQQLITNVNVYKALGGGWQEK